ncbi:MAG TPA: ATP-binding protein [Gemmataceae bacterium]|nr:ATP-binding protein [Gemmataceae bacterium]
MDLNDFGTECDSSSRHAHPAGAPYHHPNAYGTVESPTVPIQWKIAMPGIYEACGTTHRKLPAGAYGCSLNQYGEPQLLVKDLQVDDLIDFANSLPSQILTEIENFWSLGEKFQRYGYLHRRGYLLYGPQGSGKSSVVHQVVHRIIKAGHVAVFCEHPGVLTRTMELFRKIEADRPLVCMFEDIDAIIEIHGDSELLQWLDGSHQINKVINIATTNYPERLDRRIVSRPRRFDRIIKIEAPVAHIREAYLAKKLPELQGAELTRWVELTDGLSFAALAELVISVACLGNSLEGTVEVLRSLDDQHPSSREFERPGNMGFGAMRNQARTQRRPSRREDDIPF